MGFFKVFGFIVIYLTCTLSFNNADPCEMRGPCVCVFSNGTGIDLTPAISTEFYTASTYEVKMNGSQYEMSTYYYHPCYDVNLNVSQSIPKNTCTLPLSVSCIAPNIDNYSRYIVIVERLGRLTRYGFHNHNVSIY